MFESIFISSLQISHHDRIAQLVLDGSKEKKIVRKYGQHIGKDEHTALILLVSILALQIELYFLFFHF